MKLWGLGVLGLALAGSACGQDAAPSEAVLQQVLTKELKAIKGVEYQRTVLYDQVRRVSSQGGYHRFVVTASVHDYNAGYPPNGYWGQSCLGRFVDQAFDLRRGPAGEWIVQGRMTPDSTCKNNPAQGVSSFPMAQIGGRAASTAPVAGAQPVAPTGGQLYVGEYACYGTMGRMMTGMGFRLNGERYADLDGARGGAYTYNAGARTITFRGGYMDGQVGRDVSNTGFQISSTVNCEPWR